MTEPKLQSNASLADLRRAIDKIDAQIHDLLMARAEIVETLGQRKRQAGSDGAFFRPGREAQILRQVAARHHGSLPAEAVLSLWRTMVSAYLRLQWPFKVIAVEDMEVRDLARRHFGAATPITTAAAANDAIAAVADGGAVLAAVGDPGQDAWWLNPLFRSPAGPRIVARLPVFGPPSPTAFVIAKDMPDASGDDLTLLVIPGLAEEAMARLPLDLSSLATYKAPDGTTALLAAAPGFGCDAAAVERALNAKVYVVGGHARPLDLSRP